VPVISGNDGGVRIDRSLRRNATESQAVDSIKPCSCWRLRQKLQRELMQSEWSIGGQTTFKSSDA